MHCPLDSTPLELRSVEGHSGYRCNSCRGAWLPARYIESIKHSREFDAAAFAQALRDGRQGSSGLPCPQGCGPLTSSTFAGLSLCGCDVCHGVWFSSGSIGSLLARYKPTSAQPVPKVLVADGAISLILAALGALWP